MLMNETSAKSQSSLHPGSYLQQEDMGSKSRAKLPSSVFLQWEGIVLFTGSPSATLHEPSRSTILRQLGNM